MICSRSVLLLLVSLYPAIVHADGDTFADLCSEDGTVKVAGWEALAAAKKKHGGLGKKMPWPTAKTDAKKDPKTLTAECTETYHEQENGMFAAWSWFLRKKTRTGGKGCCEKCHKMPFGWRGCNPGMSCQAGRCLPAGAAARFGEGAKKVVGTVVGFPPIFSLTFACGAFGLGCVVQGPPLEH